MTVVIQSSSAAIGVLQQLAYQGAITYQQAVPFIFGDNIGTTITALLASIGTSVAARRTALTHTIFNVLGTIIFLPLFLMGFFEKLVVWFTNYLFILLPGFTGTWDTLNIKLQIAQTHAVFNISNAMIQLPFVAILACIVTKLIADRDEDQDPYRTKYIDRRFLNNPPVALAQAKRETLHMARMAFEAFHNAIDHFKNPQEESLEKSQALEAGLDRLEREITDYVVLASRKQLSMAESISANIILQSLNDIERIGDHCENIIEQADYAQKNQVSFSGEAQQELDNIIEITRNALILAYQTLEHHDKAAAEQVLPLEEEIDDLTEDYRKNHIRRLNEGKCNGSNGAVFLDMLTNLERVSDHCRNIAQYILEEVS
jgi:phosphate:Na+ symporter